MKYKYFFLFVITALIILLGGFFLYKKLTTPKIIHFHAGFQVYVNNVIQNYSDQKYMSLLPCGKVYNSPQLEQQERAHLHDQVGDVVHVHRVGATWADLFKNMHVSFGNEPIVGYIRGKKVNNIMTQPIHPYDQAIILVGKHGPISNYLKNQVTIAHILKIERGAFEDCGTQPQ